jgi:hypothetical protein
MKPGLNYEENKFLESQGVSVSSNNSEDNQLDELADLPPISQLNLSPSHQRIVPDFQMQSQNKIQFTSANLQSKYSLNQQPLSKLELDPPSFQNIITAESVQELRSKPNSKQPTPRRMEVPVEQTLHEQEDTAPSPVQRISINGESIKVLPGLRKQETIKIKKGAKIKKSFEFDEELIIAKGEGVAGDGRRYTFSSQSIARSPKNLFNKYNTANSQGIIEEVDEEHLNHLDVYQEKKINCDDLKKQFFEEEDAQDFATWSVNKGITNNNIHTQSALDINTKLSQQYVSNLTLPEKTKLVSQARVSKESVPLISQNNRSQNNVISVVKIDESFPNKDFSSSHKNFESNQSSPKYLYLKKSPVSPQEAQPQNIFYNNSTQSHKQTPVDVRLSEPKEVIRPKWVPSDLCKIKRALGLVREMCSGLSNEDTYMKLKMIKENELQLNEYLVVKVYEMIQPYIKDYKAAKKAGQSLQMEMNERVQKLDSLLTDFEKQRVEFGRRESEYKRQKESLEMELKIKCNQIELLKKEELMKENQLLMLGRKQILG